MIERIDDSKWFDWLANFREENGFPHPSTYLIPCKDPENWIEKAQKLPHGEVKIYQIQISCIENGKQILDTVTLRSYSETYLEWLTSMIYKKLKNG